MALYLRAFGPFVMTTMLCVLAPAAAVAADTPPLTGGTTFVAEPAPPPVATPGRWTGEEVPGTVAQLLADGTAAAPADAPDQVKQAIWAANALKDLPYLYGGGHNLQFDVADGADCSGTVSYALIHAGLLKSPLDSGSFFHFGKRGRGQWITIFTNSGHAFAVIAGLRLDTSSYATRALNKRKYSKALERGPRWRPTKRPGKGFRKRHPVGF